MGDNSKYLILLEIYSWYVNFT